MISTILNKKRTGGAVGKIAVAAFWLAVWQIVYVAVGQEILVVSPVLVFQRLCALAGSPDFWLTALSSVCRILEGFAAGAAAGTILAVLCCRFRICLALLRPLIHVVRSTPVASFIILALVWMQPEFVPAFSSIVIVLPILWENILEGLRKTDRNLLQMAGMFRFGSLRTVRRLYIPSVLPYFTAACTTGMGLAWKGGVAAEVLASVPFSIGGQIYNAKIYLETEDLFAWTAVVILLSVLLESLMNFTIRRLRTGGGENP